MKRFFSSQMSTSHTSPSLSYCLSLLRQGDYDRYLAVLFAPLAKREALAALYAFQLEIARIADVVKEPLAGEMRLRWWADQIEMIENSPLPAKEIDAQEAGNPLLSALRVTLATYDLPKKPLLAAIDARIADLYPHDFTTRRDFEFYCGETSSIFFQLACQILDPGQSRHAVDASGHAGVAETLSRLLSRFGYSLLGVGHIPLDLLAAVGLDRERLTTLQEDDTTCAHLASALLSYTYEHYGAFAAASKQLPASLKPAFLSLTPLPIMLRMMERKGAALFKIPSPLSPLRRQWIISRTALTGRFRL